MSSFKIGNIVKPNGKFKTSNYLELKYLDILEIVKIIDTSSLNLKILNCRIIKGYAERFNQIKVSGDIIQIYSSCVQPFNDSNKKLNYSIC